MEHWVIDDLFWNALGFELANKLELPYLSNVLIRSLALLRVHAHASFLANEQTYLVKECAALHTVGPWGLLYWKALV